MTLKEVLTSSDSKRFMALPMELYKENKLYIRPIQSEIENIFNVKTNRSFENGKCTRWILEKENLVIGRIAAFTREIISKDNEKSISGGVGFFECIYDQNAANQLFNVAKEWLTSEGATYMDGPINFGNRDKWWGLLTQGFNLEPNYQCNYNFPYYSELFENYGFRTYFEQFTFTRKIQDPLHPRLLYKADLIKKDAGYRMVKFNLNKIKEHTEALVKVYNLAWTNHEGVSQISMEEGEAFIKQLKPILNPELIWFAFYEEEPVAFYLNIPEVNQLLKYAKGRMNVLGKLKFAYHRWRKKNTKLLGMVFGIIPKHQGKGVDGAMIKAFHDNLLQKPNLKYETIEINGIGDFNRKMILVIKQVGGEVCKVHTTYRFLFDREQPFERMKFI